MTVEARTACRCLIYLSISLSWDWMVGITNSVISNKLNSQAIKSVILCRESEIIFGCQQHKLSLSCFWTVVNHYLYWGIQTCRPGSQKTSSLLATAFQTTAWRIAYYQRSGPPMKQATSGHTSSQFSFFHTILWKCLVGKARHMLMPHFSIHCGTTLLGCSVY